MHVPNDSAIISSVGFTAERRSGRRVRISRTKSKVQSPKSKNQSPKTKSSRFQVQSSKSNAPVGQFQLEGGAAGMRSWHACASHPESQDPSPGVCCGGRHPGCRDGGRYRSNQEFKVSSSKFKVERGRWPISIGGGCRRYAFLACLRVTSGVSRPFPECALWGETRDVETGVVIVQTKSSRFQVQSSKSNAAVGQFQLEGGAAGMRSWHACASHPESQDPSPSVCCGEKPGM